MNKRLYPFTAIVGQEHVKKAILLNIIEPCIGGVLLSGEKGTAKSTIVRSIESLMSMSVVTIPLNATEDRILGSINMEHALKTGEMVYESGLLKKAHKNVLYIDEVNLLSGALSNTILDASVSNRQVVEREGLSCEYETDFILIGSMNPEEGFIKSQMLDRFGFYVDVKGSHNKDERVEIIRRRLEYEDNPKKFIASYQDDEILLKDKVLTAKALFKETVLSDQLAEMIAKICNDSGVAGHRADMALTIGSKAHAAFEGRKYVTIQDVEAVLMYVMPHRMREMPEESPPPENQEEGESSNNNESIENSFEAHEEHTFENIEDEVFEIDEGFQAKDILKDTFKKSLKIEGSGRRNKTRTDSTKGRYIKHRQPKGKIQDIAFDATLRQAAPFQNHREKKHLLINIKREDIREKVREDRIGNLIMFLVDASGSMGVNRRMSMAKGAVFSLLQNAYQKRDTVGLMTFRGDEASVVLNPTRSIDLAYKRLQEIETGGRTPLSLGLKKAVDFIKSNKAKNKNILPIVIIISDGKNNVSLTDRSYLDELDDISQEASKEKIEFIVIDSETGFLRLGLAKNMADKLDGRYLSLDELRDNEIVEMIDQIG